MPAFNGFKAHFAVIERLVDALIGLATKPRVLVVLILAMAAFAFLVMQPRGPTIAYWSAIDVSGDSHSGDAHLIEFDNGDVILIDTGYAGYTQVAVIPYLKKKGIAHIDVILITHAHLNHYGGLLEIVQNFSVAKVYFNEPDAAVCQAEAARDRCSLKHVRQQLQQVSELTQVLTVQTNDRLYQAGAAQLQTIHVAMSQSELGAEAPKDITTRFTVNESSAVTKLTLGETSVLFPGDIGPIVGDYLVNNNGSALKSTLLAAPHHGVTPMPNKAFFERVSPQTIIASISKAPYVGERGQALRDFAAVNDIPLYVSGYVGTVQIELAPDSFRVLNP